MTHTSFVAASLMSRSSSVRSPPAPLAAVAQRPFVLTRASHVPQQLTLFGPPGVRR